VRGRGQSVNVKLSFGDLQRADEGNTEVCLILREEPGQAEIANLGLELVVQEYVAGLDVAVNDPQIGIDPREGTAVPEQCR
jgi:hypothetical protein